MYKLNNIQYPNIQDISFNSTKALEALKNNDLVQDEIKKFAKTKGFSSLNTFSFSQDGFLSLMLKLNGKILVSKGESQAIIDAALKYKDLGFDLEFIGLNSDGLLNYKEIQECSYIFASPYIMDTFVKVDMEQIKNRSKAKIISNISAMPDFNSCDVAILDSYKLTGYAFSSIILHNEFLEEQYLANIDTLAFYEIKDALEEFKPNCKVKDEFKKLLEQEFKDSIHFFVDSNLTLPYTLHFGLKGIKAREIIRTLALSDIYLTNGEGCSLGLSKPSRIIQDMGNEELKARWSLSLSFFQEFSYDDIVKIVKTISKKYRQIRMLND